MSFMGGVRTSSFDASYRAVLQASSKVSNWLNCLTYRLLNSIYAVADSIKCEYLCIAKVPYYGRSTYRHRAYDNASPLQDAAGSRDIVCEGWTIV